MNRGRAIAIGVVVALAAIVAAPVSASADIVFTPPQSLAGPEAATPQVVVDPQGRATVLWQELGAEGKTLLVRTTRIDASGFPGPTHTLAEFPKVIPQCVCPDLAVDPLGRVAAVWQTVTKDGRRIEAAQINSAGSPQPTQILSPLGVEGWAPKLAVNAEGEVAVVWETTGTGQRIEAVMLGPDGTPGEVHPLSEEGEGRLAVIAVGPGGRFYSAWTGDGIETTKLNEEGAPETVQSVSPPGEAAGIADIVVDSKGRATISWWRGAGAYEAKAVRLAADGTPGTVRTLSPPEQDAWDPRLAVDPQDRVTAVWQDFEERVFSVRLDEEGVPGELQQLSPEGHLAGEPQIAAAANGRVVVTWTYPPPVFIPEPGCLELELEPDDDVVRAAFIEADGELDRIYDVSAYGEQSFSAELALDPFGLPWVAWTSFDGTYFCDDWNNRVQASHAIVPQPPEEEPEGVPPGAPPAPIPPQEPVTLRVAKKGVVQRGRIALRVRCNGTPGGTCSGALRLLTAAVDRQPDPGKEGRKRRPAVVSLARGRYRLSAGKAKKLSLPITKAARRFLASREPSWITAQVRGPGIARTKVLLRLSSLIPSPK